MEVVEKGVNMVEWVSGKALSMVLTLEQADPVCVLTDIVTEDVNFNPICAVGQ